MWGRCDDAVHRKQNDSVFQVFWSRSLLDAISLYLRETRTLQATWNVSYALREFGSIPLGLGTSSDIFVT